MPVKRWVSLPWDVTAGRTGSRPVAVARIAVAAAALVKLGALLPLLARLARPDVLQVPVNPAGPGLSPGAVGALAVVWAGAGFAFLLGWRTRASGAVLTAAAFVALLSDQQLYSNHLYLLMIVLGLLTLAHSGAAISLDARRRGERSSVPAWPVVLLKLQLSIVYGFAALAKINVMYLSGGVLNAYIGRGSILPLPEGIRTVEVMAPLAMLSILAETFLALAVWSERWRSAAFGLGLAFHAAIVLTMTPAVELSVFSIVMFALYLLHLDAPPRSRIVVWDDTCGFCGTWIRWLRRLDWLHVHRFVGGSSRSILPAGITREEADTAIQLVAPQGRSAGFQAVSRMLEVMPLTFLWAPFLRNRWIQRLGDQAYRRVAARRRCAVRPPATSAR